MMKLIIVFVSLVLGRSACGVMLRGSGQALQLPKISFLQTTNNNEKTLLHLDEGKNKNLFVHQDEDLQEASYLQGKKDDIENGLRQIAPKSIRPGEEKEARRKLYKLVQDGIDGKGKGITAVNDILRQLMKIGREQLEDSKDSDSSLLRTQIDKLLTFTSARRIAAGTPPTTEEPRPPTPDRIRQHWEEKKDTISEDHLKKALGYIGMDNIYDKLADVRELAEGKNGDAMLLMLKLNALGENETEPNDRWKDNMKLDMDKMLNQMEKSREQMRIRKMLAKKSTSPKQSESLQGATEDIEKGLKLLTTKNVPPVQEKQARETLAEEGAISRMKFPTHHEERMVDRQLGGSTRRRTRERPMRKAPDRLNSRDRLMRSQKQAKVSMGLSDQQHIQDALVNMWGFPPARAREVREYLEKEQNVKVLDFLKRKGMNKNFTFDEPGDHEMVTSTLIALESWKAMK